MDYFARQIEVTLFRQAQSDQWRCEGGFAKIRDELLDSVPVGCLKAFERIA
jgi:hypothetical protein